MNKKDSNSKSDSEHWDSIFLSSDDSTLGWYEKDLTKTFDLLDQIDQWQDLTLFISGAGTSILVDELVTRNIKMILNDISIKALETLKIRLGEYNNIVWLHQDISQPVEKEIPAIDIWIDRAVLHFLNDEEMIKGYFTNLKSHLKPGGYIFFAEFSQTGAHECAGLPIHQYSVNELSQRLGSSFRLMSYFDHIYINPKGENRPYIYALFQSAKK